MTNENVTLPLLPLTSGVVLPGMVFTMALESDEARAAVESARSAGGRLLLVPHIDGRFASVGVVAEVMEEGDLPGGTPAVAIRGDHRATIGTGVPGTGNALWVEAEPIEEPEATPAAIELAREYRAVLENILHTRGAGRIAAQLRDITEPSRLADVAGYSPDLSLSQKVEVLETLDAEARLRLVLGWARDTLADLTLREKIKTDVEEGMEKTQREFLLRRQLDAIRKELNSLSGSDGDGEDPDDYRAKLESARAARGRPQGRRARGRQARAHLGPEPGDGLDPHVARHSVRDPVGRRVRGPSRHRRGVSDPRGGPRRAEGREGADPRAPRRAQAPGRARPGAGERPAGLGSDPGVGRPSGCRQDVVG